MSRLLTLSNRGIAHLSLILTHAGSGGTLLTNTQRGKDFCSAGHEGVRGGVGAKGTESIR